MTAIAIKPPLYDFFRAVDKYLAYLGYLFTHKRHVYVVGRQLGVKRLRLLAHDLDKLYPSNIAAHAAHFYGPRDAVIDEAYERAKLAHVFSNEHHPEFWYGVDDAFEMSDQATREMVADWEGAAIAKGGVCAPIWYFFHKHQFVLHERTEKLVRELLDQLN